MSVLYAVCLGFLVSWGITFSGCFVIFSVVFQLFSVSPTSLTVGLTYLYWKTINGVGYEQPDQSVDEASLLDGTKMNMKEKFRAKRIVGTATR